jgi:hypothetical protein
VGGANAGIHGAVDVALKASQADAVSVKVWQEVAFELVHQLRWSHAKCPIHKRRRVHANHPTHLCA